MSTQPVAPDVRAFLDRVGPAPERYDVASLRAAAEQLAALPQRSEPVGDIETHLTDAGTPIRVYRPDDAGGHPLVVLFHGGGWVRCSLDTHDAICRALCALTPAVVASVDYRLAPEHRFPTGLEDCYAATRWAADNAERLGADPARVAVCGDSSGGNFAAAVALLCRDRGGPRLAFQLLVYPVTDYEFHSESFDEYADGFQLTAEQVRFYWSCYVASTDEALDPRVSVLRADLRGLPPAHVITAACDPLRDQAEAYAHRLRRHGVPATIARFDGMIHGFWSMPWLFASSRAGVEHSARVLREALAVTTAP